jgi:MtN3 and saliva related transmembrane protein
VKIFFQIWCTSLGLAFIWPQVWRAARHDTSHGISPFGLMHGIVGSSLWLTYGILQGDAAIWFSNISFIVAQSIIISVVYRHGKIPRQVLVRVGAALFALALLLTQVSATPVGFVAIAVSGSSIVPQLIHVIRTENLHGISISSYLIAILNCSSWLIYGFIITDPMVSAQNFFAIPIIMYITFKAYRWRAANPNYVANPA